MEANRPVRAPEAPKVLGKFEGEPTYLGRTHIR